MALTTIAARIAMTGCAMLAIGAIPAVASTAALGNVAPAQVWQASGDGGAGGHGPNAGDGGAGGHGPTIGLDGGGEGGHGPTGGGEGGHGPTIGLDGSGEGGHGPS